MQELARIKLIDFISPNAILVTGKNNSWLKKNYKMIFFSYKKIIETMIDWINLSPLVTYVIDSTEFNNFFFYKIFFNYIIKIYGYKIEQQPKNKNLFETMITL
jgi:hypothetical protein